MSRHRIERPLGLSKLPNVVTCKQRETLLLKEFLRRFDYVLSSYRLGFQTIAFNASLRALKHTVRFGRQRLGRGQRLHPLLELAVNHHARCFATERTGEQDAQLTQDDVEKAAARVAARAIAQRGRPRAELLDHHLAGLMALLQEATGKAVLESRHAGTGDYQPKLLGVGRVLLHLKEIDPSITETQLVTKVHAVRRNYAGQPMRFRDFYPLYGATLNPEGDPILAPPLRLNRFEQSIPIYCP